MMEKTNRLKAPVNSEVRKSIEQKETRATDGRGYSQGYNSATQKLDRYISFLPSVAFDATLQASWEAVAVSFQAGLLNGGPTSLVWGTLLAWIGSAALAASLGEMASINPTVGAQYRWTALYTPRGFGSPAFWSLLQGWITVTAWMATCAQVAFLEGTVIQGLIILNDPTYIYQRWHGTLLAWAIIVLPFFFNVFARRTLAPLEVLGGIGHLVFLVVFVAVLVALAPHSLAEYVFTTTTTGISGWDTPGIEWCIGLLSAAFPLGSFDGIIHMSAEVRNPEKRVPQSMVMSVFINGLFCFAFIITLLFTIGDPETALSSPTGYPIIEVLLNATGSYAATTFLMCTLVFMGLVAEFSTLASVSRLVWAFSRDKGLPFSDFFSHVHPRLRIPLNALGLVTVFCVLITLISIGNTTAFFAILSLNTLALYISYFLPILFFTITKLRGEKIPYGPFRLGHFGLPINVFALVYAVFIAIFLPFPPFIPVTAATMNYGGPVMGAVILFAILDWCISGRRRFKAPIHVRQLEEIDNGETNA